MSWEPGPKGLEEANKIFEDFSRGRYILYLTTFTLEFLIILILVKTLMP